MTGILISILTQSLLFLPLAFAISTSYHILRATDMTIDGSFVIGAAIFARMVTLGISPVVAAFAALAGGALAGMLSATIQRGGRVDPLLAGVLATFILSSVNLIIMGKPNISLLEQTTLVSFAFEKAEIIGWILIGFFSAIICGSAYFILKSKIGLALRAFGDNPILFKRLGNHVEIYRTIGFTLTNLLAAAAGCLTAQTVGYADIGMGFGMTLTGIGAIILGQQVYSRISNKKYLRVGSEFLSCLLGIVLYYFTLNILLKLDVNPIYLKMILGILLIIFLRSAITNKGVNT